MKAMKFSALRLLKVLELGRSKPLRVSRVRTASRIIENLEPRSLLSATLDTGLLTLTGTAGNDRISIRAGANPGEVIVNGVADFPSNQLFTGVDNIIINGSDGNDTITIGHHILDRNSFLINVTVNGGTGNDKITGGDGDDDLNGDAGDDTLTGGAGDDQLDGGDDDDKLNGGNGNDTESGGNGDDKLSGDAGNDTLNGDSGDDTITGGTGDDSLNGGDDDDTISGGAGTDTALGGLGNDTITGDAGNDTLNGDDGNDKISGGAGDDLENGGSGDDNLSGGAGNDSLSGGADDDHLTGDGGNDSLNGDDGADDLHGGGGNDNLSGGLDDDTLHGDGGNDSLNGDGGSDHLFGGGGSDDNLDDSDNVQDHDAADDEEPKVPVTGPVQTGLAITEAEFNDVRSNANAFALDQTGATQVISGQTSSLNDRDYYRFTPTAGGTVTLSVNSDPANATKIEVESSTGGNSLELEPGDDAVNSGQFTVQAGVTYFIRADADKAVSTYQLSVTFAPSV